MKTKRIRHLLKGLIFDAFIVLLQFGSIATTHAGPNQLSEFTDADILKSSQISYRAEGGFSGVQSYGVILSCVNGQVSVMKSIYDPRLNGADSRTREITTMAQGEYMQLWNNMDQQALFKMKDAPQPKMEIADEFTVHFYAKVGENYHQFEVYGISQPLAARYFALRKLIDDSVQMHSLWKAHEALAKHLESPTMAAEKAN